MFHMATLMTTFATFQMGGTNVLTRRVDAEELCRVIEAERCNYGFVMGPTAEEIMAVNGEGRYDLSGFRTFGGSPAWNAMVQVDDSPWGTHPAGYGQTEVTGMLTFNALGVGTAGTSGRPSPLAQVRIVDPEGAEVPDGETGEIVARGPIVTNGYHDRPELNAERFRGGWWHTERPRAAPPRRLDQLRGAVDPDREVGGGEHLSRRGGGLPGPPPGGT